MCVKTNIKIRTSYKEYLKYTKKDQEEEEDLGRQKKKVGCVLKKEGSGEREVYKRIHLTELNRIRI